METAGKNGPRQTRVEIIHQWPMFREKYKGLTNSLTTQISDPVILSSIALSVGEEVKKALLLAASQQGDKKITRRGDTKFVR